MATGILSVVASEEGLAALSLALLLVAAAAHLTLVATRLPLLRRDAWRRPVGLSTFVAGTAVLGTRLAHPAWRWPALALFAVAAAAWFTLLPGWLARMARASLSGASGRWLLAVVAPESLAVLAASLAPLLFAGGLLDAALFLWGLGAVLYLGLGCALGRRIALGRLPPAALTPDWWIVSGAASITCVAGATIAAAERSDFVRLVSVLAWGVAGAAIVVLILGELLRIAATGDLLGSVADRYSTVFPLGMFGAASEATSRLLGSGALEVLADVVFWVALAGWLALTIALVYGRPGWLECGGCSQGGPPSV